MYDNFIIDYMYYSDPRLRFAHMLSSCCRRLLAAKAHWAVCESLTRWYVASIHIVNIIKL